MHASTMLRFLEPLSHVLREILTCRIRAYTRLRGRQTLCDRPHTNTRLTKAEEAAICSYIDRLDRLNLSARSGHIRGAAESSISEDPVQI